MNIEYTTYRAKNPKEYLKGCRWLKNYAESCKKIGFKVLISGCNKAIIYTLTTKNFCYVKTI